MPTLNRRHFLRAAGISMSLPWLESLGASEPGTGKSQVGQPPKRVGVVFFGNGVHEKHWGASQKGTELVLKQSLAPLEAVKKQVLVFSRMGNKAAHGGHYSSMNVLSGTKVKKSTTSVQLGESMDQVIARHIGGQTSLPHLVIGTEGDHKTATPAGYSPVYQSHISWATATRPVPKEIFPRLAFDRLFNANANIRQNKSILDAVLQEANHLRRDLSANDKRKFNDYLESVRELETRIERAEASDSDRAAWTPSITEPWMPRPSIALPDLDTHHRMMLDIMVLAFQMDKTRVITHMMSNDQSDSNFSFLGGIKGGMHEISHHSNRKHYLAMYQKINQYHAQVWSEALQKMAKVQEGEHSLLDNTVMIMLCNLSDGNKHESKYIPFVMAGGQAWGIKGGRHIVAKGEERKLCRLYLSLMQMMGVPAQAFGDAKRNMHELLTT